LLTLTLGITSFIQTSQLHDQTLSLYNHPLQVRTAIDGINLGVTTMQLDLRKIMLANIEQQKQDAQHSLQLSATDIEIHFSTIKDRYLGPKTDIEKAYNAYITWKVEQDISVGLALEGKIEQIKIRLEPNGTQDVTRAALAADMNVINEFATMKSDEFLQTSINLNRDLKNQLATILVSFLLITLLIGFYLFTLLKNPLNEMNSAVQKFHGGDLDARSVYAKDDEFGILSKSINSLADNVQNNLILNEKSIRLAEVMLSEEDAHRFFQATLRDLIEMTGATMGAIYLLDDTRSKYMFFEGVGTSDKAKPTFMADASEGEFAMVLTTKNVNFIKDIPEDTRFIFQTVEGHFIPRELITIPLSTNNHVIAIISLATIQTFQKNSLDFINNNLVALSARTEGILAYRKIKEFSDELSLQNAELGAQKKELSAQSAELSQQNTELEMQKKQLVEASQLKTNFLSNMSHELRTPLNSVIALSGVLHRRLENKLPAEEYSFLEVIERNGRNLLLLINDILDISRIESGHEEIEISKFNMNTLMDDVLDMVKPQADQKSVAMVHETSGTDLYVLTDFDKCHHILQNLIGNAVKFTEHGQVTISARVHDENIEVKVADSGIGISAEHLPFIFDEFRQADGTTSRRYGGSGLGLTIAKKYANLLGGTINVKSTVDLGSEFTLILPSSYDVENRIQEEEESFVMNSPKKAGDKRIDSQTRDKTVLIVEDNEAAIIQIRDLVEEIGVRVLVANNAAEAFNIIDNILPDAMILDLMMPVIDGFSILQTIRDNESTALVPVLILTSKHITKEDLKNLKRNNIHQLIQKGDIDRQQLQQAVLTMIHPERSIVAQRPLQDIQGMPKILVVEDNPDNMITVRAMLSGEYTVIEAVNGNEAIAMARQHVPHLILMDIALPGINGIEAFQRIRAIPSLSNVPVIALTASAMEKDREAILSHGFDAYIAKPIIAKEFFKVINEVLYGK
jgi:signal transduction histidine kinase/CheY-like chemotaxis protein/HAMP domain-containing protein